MEREEFNAGGAHTVSRLGRRELLEDTLRSFVRREAAHLLTRWLLLRDHHYLWLVAGSSPTGLPSRLVLLRLLGKFVNFEDMTLQAEERGEPLLTHVTFVNFAWLWYNIGKNETIESS